MEKDKMSEIIEKLKKCKEMNFSKPATKEQIEAFEKKNKIELPKQFKEWLLFSDGGDLYLPAGVQFYGVAHKPLIDPEDDSRPDKKYLVIGALDTGDPILCCPGSESIAIYNQEADRIEDDERYDDFSAFLNDLPNILGLEDEE